MGDDYAGPAPPTFDVVPDHLKLRVFERLETARDRVAVASACRKWRSMAGDIRLWKGERTLVIGPGVPPEDAIEIVKLFSPGVKSLQYSNLDDEARNEQFVLLLRENRIRLKKITLVGGEEAKDLSLAGILEHASENDALETVAFLKATFPLRSHWNIPLSANPRLCMTCSAEPSTLRKSNSVKELVMHPSCFRASNYETLSKVMNARTRFESCKNAHIS
jgi:hypothetical protein